MFTTYCSETLNSCSSLKDLGMLLNILGINDQILRGIKLRMRERKSRRPCYISIRPLLAALSFGLLLKIVLHPALLGLASVVLVLVLGLLGTIASQAGDSATDGAGDAVSDTRAEIVELTAGLLFLTGPVLLPPGRLEVLAADEATDKFLGRAGRLVPRAGGAVRIILAHTRGRNGRAGHLDRGVRSVVLCLTLVLLGLPLSLLRN